MENLIELDKKHFIHPTSSIKEQQEKGAKLIIEKGDGIYLTDTDGRVFIDAMSSLWNVNIGHGRKELAERGKGANGKVSLQLRFFDIQP